MQRPHSRRFATSSERPRVLLVGLGRAAELTVAALREEAIGRVVAGIDPLGRDARAKLPSDVPVSRSVAGAPPADVALVATPTPTHAAVCNALVAERVRVPLILCEKPLAVGSAAVRAVFETARAAGVALGVLLHYAYAPEVLWLAETLADARITSFEARFEDPYAADLEATSAVLTSSWVDSGINALSVLSRLVELQRVVSSTGNMSGSETTIAFTSCGRAGLGTIVTSWLVPLARKETLVTLADGSRIRLDHNRGTAERDGRVVFRSAGGRPRLDRYRSMLRAHFREEPTVVGLEQTLLLHDLLAEASAPHDGLPS